MSERRDFNKMPPEPIRLTWCDWLRWHTIDPNTVAVNGFIEIDKEACQIRYLTYDLNEEGKQYIDSTGTRTARSVQIYQLEAQPSDFPPGL